MKCINCLGQAELKQFTTFEYYFCNICRVEIKEDADDIIKALAEPIMPESTEDFSDHELMRWYGMDDML